MDTLYKIYEALTNAQIDILNDPHILLTLYFVLFLILFFESGVLPAAFLPGDSLLFLTGLLISQNVLHFFWVNLALVLGAGFGTWFGHIQGVWLGNTKIIQRWIVYLPKKYFDRTQLLFTKYGLQALFVGRFIPFVRTALPVIAGISGLQGKKFHLYNWVSAILWIGLIITAGYFVGLTPLFEQYKTGLLKFFSLIPVVFIVIGLVSAIIVAIKRKRKLKDNK